MQDITNPSELPENQRKAPFLLKKELKLSWFDLAIQKWLSKRISRDVEKTLERVIRATPQKTNSAQDTGLAKHGEEMKLEEVLARLEKHEAECNLRYQRIEERLDDQKDALKSLDLKIWGLAILIIVAPLVHKFLG